MQIKDLSWINSEGGRKVIKTNLRLTGDIANDIDTIKLIIEKSLPIHKKNVLAMNELFSIFYNNQKISLKYKQQRNDINNKIGVSNAYSITRTINSYCFGEPFKYLANDTSNQVYVERLNSILNYAGNYNQTISATLNSSVCGIGYKIALPKNDDEIPFKINGDIDPRKAFRVYTDEVIPECIIAVYMQDKLNKEGNKVGRKYTVWTNDYQIFMEDDDESFLNFRVIPQLLNGQLVDAYPTNINQIPLIEIRRNKFLLSDFELVIPLFDAKNKLLSNRLDDIEQTVDYLLVLTNCVFETEKEKQDILSNRLLTLKSLDKTGNTAKAEILRNSLDQSTTQQLANYIDELIQEIVGIPSREERSSGGDTGQAVRFRNGFRDLENNAGMIVPPMEMAELEFAKLCLKYCRNIENNPIGSNLFARDIKVVFKRTLTDDPVASSTAYYNFVKGGMMPTDALIASKSVSDPAEVGSRCQTLDINGSTSSSSSSEVNQAEETSNNEQG